MSLGRPPEKRILITGKRQGHLIVLQEIEKKVRNRYWVIRLCLACFKVERVEKRRFNGVGPVAQSCGCVGREKRKLTAARYFPEHMKRRADEEAGDRVRRQ